MRRQLLLSLVAYLGLAAAVGFCLGRINLQTLRRLSTEGVRAVGTVTAPDCGNHATVRYTFEADGREIAGVGQPGWGNPPCDQLRAGDRLEVWYVPAAPAVNRPGDPRPSLDNELVSVALAASVMPALLVGALALRGWRQRVKHAEPGDEPDPAGVSASWSS